VGGDDGQVAPEDLQVGVAQRDADAAGAQRLGGAGVDVDQVAQAHRQHRVLGRQRVQGVGREHGGDGVEEQQLVAQQPAVLVDQVFGDEADQRFEVGSADGLPPCCQQSSYPITRCCGSSSGSRTIKLV
jgi:hypothetical protein